METNARIDQLRQTLRKHLPALREHYGVASLALFGSYVRHEARPDSDLDLLVTFNEAPGLLAFVELEQHLSDVLGVSVDLVMDRALKPEIGRRVRVEAEPV